jgi:hypothetical protein
MRLLSVLMRAGLVILQAISTQRSAFTQRLILLSGDMIEPIASDFTLHLYLGCGKGSG